jgi:hypothetical protein
MDVHVSPDDRDDAIVRRVVEAIEEAVADVAIAGFTVDRVDTRAVNGYPYRWMTEEAPGG